MSANVVYVLDKNGTPLMPTKRYGKVRHLLKDKKAEIVHYEPFTIRLLYDSTTYTQSVTLGVDAGSKHVGLSASTEKKELYAAEITLRTDITKNLSTRRELRRSRRNRTTPYRKPRLKNRRRPLGWVPPSVRHKIDCIKNRVAFVCSFLPVTQIILEGGEFDIQKMKNPDIRGKEYQQGDQFGFRDVRQYVLFRDDYTCLHCHQPGCLEVHHLESRKTGGNSPSNLVTLCSVCHKKYHSLSREERNQWNLPVRGISYKDATHMNIMQKALYNELKEVCPNVYRTYGYMTEACRSQNGILKSHINDAYCIAGNLHAEPAEEMYIQMKVRRHNRQLHKVNPGKGGKRKLNQMPYEVHGFHVFDKVLYKDEPWYIISRRENGRFKLRSFDGRTKDGVLYKNLRLSEKRKGYVQNRNPRSPLKE